MKTDGQLGQHSLPAITVWPSLVHCNSRHYLYVTNGLLSFVHLCAVAVELSQFPCEHGLQQSINATATLV